MEESTATGAGFFDALNAQQVAGIMHPLTCGSGNRMDAAHTAYKEAQGHSDWGILTATEEGLFCPACGYKQPIPPWLISKPTLPQE